MKPICIDLFCGLGGWAEGFLSEGYRVIGFDIEHQPDYPGEFIRADVLKIALGGAAFCHAAVIVASPPCEQFSRYQMPWTRQRNPPPPDLSLIAASQKIARDAGVPLILENVRAAQDFIGPANWHAGAFYLWGDIPAIMPEIVYRKKESYGSHDRLKRARVPFDLAAHIARCFRP